MRRVLLVSTGLLLAVGVVYLVFMRSGGSPSTEPLSISGQEARLGTANPLSNRARVLVAPKDPARGAAAPLVTLVAFVDFSSPACKRTARTLLEAVLAYPEEVRTVLKLLPNPNDPDSVAAAEAALAAGEQGKFWQMHDLLFLEQVRLHRLGLVDKARRIGLDVAAFTARLDSHALIPVLDDTAAYAERLGVNGAPALFMNGLTIEDGAIPFVHLKLRIERELRRVRKLMEENDLSRGDVYTALMREARLTPLKRRPSRDVAAVADGAAPGDGAE